MLPSRVGFGDANVLSVDLKPIGHGSYIGVIGGGRVVLVVNKGMGPPEAQRFGACVPIVFIVFSSDKTKSRRGIGI